MKGMAGGQVSGAKRKRPTEKRAREKKLDNDDDDENREENW